MSESPADLMRLALRLAEQALHRTSPNPMVGCVIVRDGQVVGQGVTQPPGQAHAEVVALRQAGERARGATVYVTLEPCCHHGRTPPCTDALITAGVARVVAGAIDPNPLVAGRGLAQLHAAGIDTQLGPVDTVAACERAIAPFRRHILDGRPWVLLKAATSLDGRIATRGGDSKWITGEGARRDAHRLRARADAVLVGAETVRLDDPRLTVRGVPGEDPRRVVLARRLDLPPNASVVREGSLFFHAADAPADRVRALQDRGAATHAVPIDPHHEGLDLSEVLQHLGAHGVVNLLVEGGGRVHGGFLRARLADEACFYVAPRLLGEGRPAVAGLLGGRVDETPALTDVTTRRLGQDLRIRGLIRYPGQPCSPG